VIGPNADDVLALRGNYFGEPSESITVLEGIRSLVSPEAEVLFARGCAMDDPSREGFEEALQIAKKADVAVMVMGLSQVIEGEEGQEVGTPEGVVSQGDRSTLDLPGEQEALIKAVAETGTPVVLVLLNGSALAVNWADENLPAILEAWYPGQAGGRAVAEALFGDTNPGGRLPVTFYKSVEQLPPFEDYAMAGRTYRYFKGEPLYPFGHGLSYTTFEYQDLSLSHDRLAGPEIVRVSCEVANTGKMTGDEVVQVYLRDDEASTPVPRHSLAGFKRIRLTPGRAARVTCDIQPKQLAVVDNKGRWVIEPGTFTIFVGGGQPGEAAGLSVRLVVIGEKIILKDDKKSIS
jgi:beta-glucosidase